MPPKTEHTRVARCVAQSITALALTALSALLLSTPRIPLAQAARFAQKSIDATEILAIDGDTLFVSVGTKTEKVRLIGIDAPEAEDNEKAEADSKRSGQSVRSIVALGKLASKHTQTLVRRKMKIKIVLDKVERDIYGRLLGYVFLPDGSMLNERIVADGYAGLLTIPPNTMFAADFQRLCRQAQAEKAGLWAKSDHRVLES